MSVACRARLDGNVYANKIKGVQKIMKPIRFIAFLLAVLTVFSIMTACATDPESTETQDPGQSGNETEEGTGIKDDLPADLRFEGEEVVFISPEVLTYDELTGVAVEDIIYERNVAVEERLGVEINGIFDANAIDKVVTAVSGGNTDYDVMVELCWRAAPKFTGNYFRNLRSTAYLDFDKQYWNQGFNEAVEYNGIQFGITGAMLLSLYRSTYITIFNKDMFTDANQPFLYEHVENGTWTLDKQISLVPLFHRDNGNNAQDKTGDVYGFVSNDFISVDPYWSSCEVDIIKKNNDGDYEWVFDSAKLYDVADKVLKLYYGTDGGSYIENDDVASEGTVVSIYSAGNAAMATLRIAVLETDSIRGMPQEYGVVPIPKFSEDQKEYHSQMHDGFTIACLPNTVSEDRADMLSAVLESMGSVSYNVVRPTYYDTILRTQIAKDPQSAQMMDLIINNINIDAGFIYSHSMGSFHQGFQQLVDSRNNDTISRYKRMTSSAKRSLEKLVTELDKLG